MEEKNVPELNINDVQKQKAEIFKKMTMLKSKREREIFLEEQEKDEQPENKEFVADIRYLGKIEWTEEIINEKGEKEVIKSQKDIFLLLDMVDGAITYKYYDENFELLAFQNSLEDELIPTKKMLEKGNLDYLKQLNELDKNGIYSYNELAKEVEAGTLIIDEEDERQVGSAGIKEEEQEENESIERKRKERPTISAKESENIKSLETTNLNQIIKGKSLGKMLGLENEGIVDGEELVVMDRSQVSSDKLKNNTSRDVIGVKRANGEIVILGDDILKKDTKGIDIDEKNVTINNDGNVNRESITSRYQIVNGGKNQYISIGRDELSSREIKYSEWSNERGEYLDYELETSRTYYRDSEVNRFTKNGHQGALQTTKTLEKEEIHEEHECTDNNIKGIDDNDINDSHEHLEISLEDRIPNTDKTWGQLANACGYRGEGALEKVQKLFQNAYHENPDKSNQEIIDEIVMEIEEQVPSRDHNIE